MTHDAPFPRPRIARCPSCGHVHDPPPRASSPCKGCGVVSYVRSSGQLFESILLTNEQAILTDLWFSLAGIGRTRADYLRHEQIATAKLGRVPTAVEVGWSLLIEASGSSSGPDESLEVARTMAQLALKTKDFANATLFEIEAAKIELLGMKANEVAAVAILTSGDERVCAGCRQHEGKRFTIDEALAQVPIPTHCTTSKDSGEPFLRCRCSYAAVELAGIPLDDV